MEQINLSDALNNAGFYKPQFVLGGQLKHAIDRLLFLRIPNPLFGAPDDNFVECVVGIRGFVATPDRVLLIFIDAPEIGGLVPADKILFIAVPPVGAWRLYRQSDKSELVFDKLRTGGTEIDATIL